MLQMLHVIPASTLALGHRVPTGRGADSNLTVRAVRHDDAGVQVTLGAHGLSVLYPPDEEVAIIECVFDDQLEDGLVPERN